MEVLTSMFRRPFARIHARRALLTCSQQTTVLQFSVTMRTLIVTAGPPATVEPDLVDIFWRGLAHDVQNRCVVCPCTGRFWDNFNELVQYAILMDETTPSRFPQPPSDGDDGPYEESTEQQESAEHSDPDHRDSDREYDEYDHNDREYDPNDHEHNDSDSNPEDYEPEDDYPNYLNTPY